MIVYVVKDYEMIDSVWLRPEDALERMGNLIYDPVNDWYVNAYETESTNGFVCSFQHQDEMERLKRDKVIK